eukprot:scaffold3600_cov171-Amphora_coffeaeformis.AAC.4
MSFSKSILLVCCLLAAGHVDAFLVPKNHAKFWVRLSVQNNNKGTRTGLLYAPKDMEKESMPTTKELREEEPLFDHDDWVRYRTRRADESENIATALFGGFVFFLWFVAVQV